jgi:7-dehydrocholesterol reductase
MSFRDLVLPFAVIVVSSATAVLPWIICTCYDGSIGALLADSPRRWLGCFPVPLLESAWLCFGWFVFQVLLLGLPGKRCLGPLTPSGARPEYRLNGVAAWIVTHVLIFGIAYPLGWLHAARFYGHFGSLLVTLHILAVALSSFLYLKGLVYPTSPDLVRTALPVLDFFQGIELHLHPFCLNLKQMVICRFSMMGWSVIVLIFLLAQYENLGTVAPSMIASVLLQVGYVFKFFVWEEGYFHSLDMMHDRCGYYLFFGVMVWVPSFYGLPAFWLVTHPIALHPRLTVGLVLFGFFAIGFNYHIDLQRQQARTQHGNVIIWGRPAEVIRAQYSTLDGQVRESLLLVSGWWSIARHIHYVPELAAAAAWTFPTGFTHLLPWAYWIYLFGLLVDRAMRDERRCLAKYGKAWNKYVERVPWRIFPGIF